MQEKNEQSEKKTKGTESTNLDPNLFLITGEINKDSLFIVEASPPSRGRETI
jgi:hypothetical protein